MEQTLSAASSITVFLTAFLSNLHTLESFHLSPQEAEEAYKRLACAILGVWLEIYSCKTCGFVWTRRLILCDEF